MSQKEAISPIKCRCGGQPSKPEKVSNCQDRWLIYCQVPRCAAKNNGQGFTATVMGWNRLSAHFYR